MPSELSLTLLAEKLTLGAGRWIIDIEGRHGDGAESQFMTDAGLELRNFIRIEVEKDADNLFRHIILEVYFEPAVESGCFEAEALRLLAIVVGGSEDFPWGRHD